MDSNDRSQDEPQRQRLEALVNRLTNEQLQTSLGDGWTVAVALAHLAFWDRRAAALVKRWQAGARLALADETTTEALNEALLPLWQALPARAAADEALAAARAVDQALDAASPEFIQQIIVAGNPINPARGNHRAEHIEQIERALGV